jgi:hypothetical protein
MATRESNVIMFPQRIHPERKEDVRIAEQSLEKIDRLNVKGLRRDLVAAEGRAWIFRADDGARAPRPDVPRQIGSPGK